jgi:NADH-quinone oxidoreductase subunit M
MTYYLINSFLILFYLTFLVINFCFFDIIGLMVSLIVVICILLNFVIFKFWLIQYKGLLKYWVLLFTVTIVIISLGLAINYLNDLGLCNSTMAFLCDYKFFESTYFGFSINYTGGVDGISLCLICLTLWLLIVCVVTVWEHEDFLLICFFLYLVVFFCVNVFYLLDLFLFYMFFELVLLPMIFIIGYWGSQERRIVAIYRFFLYTFIGSMGFFFVLFYLIFVFGTVNFCDLYLENAFNDLEQEFLWFFTFIAFAVKVPLYPLHTWLPEAHAEAPTVGSILLAGILLKMGPYGIIRFSNFLFPYGLVTFQFFVIFLCLCGVYYTTLIALRQIDLKKIIAYSSVGHMSFVVVGICSFNYEGYIGAVMLMISHGFVSSGLFLLVGFLYERYHSRSLLYYKGLIQINPKLGFFMFLFLLGNIGFPGTFNFVSEVFILLGVFDYNILLAMMLIFSTVFVLAYNLWFYSSVFFGEYTNSIDGVLYNELNINYSFLDNSRLKRSMIIGVDLVTRESILAIILVLPVFIFGLYPKPFFELLNPTIINLLASNQYVFDYSVTGWTGIAFIDHR